MHFIYGEGRTGELDFKIVPTREAVPTTARVFAMCSKDHVTETFGEHMFHRMSDGEFYALRAAIREAADAERQQQSRNHVLMRLMQWLES